MTEFLASLLRQIESVSADDIQILEARLKKTDPSLGEREVAEITDVFIKKTITLLAMIEEEMKMSLRKYSQVSQEHQTSALRTVFSENPESPEFQKFRTNYVHLHESREMLLCLISSSVRYDNSHIGIGDLAIRNGWRVVFNSYMSMEMLSF